MLLTPSLSMLLSELTKSHKTVMYRNPQLISTLFGLVKMSFTAICMSLSKQRKSGTLKGQLPHGVSMYCVILVSL